MGFDEVDDLGNLLEIFILGHLTIAVLNLDSRTDIENEWIKSLDALGDVLSVQSASDHQVMVGGCGGSQVGFD